MQPKVQVQEFQEKAAAPARPREPPALCTHHIIIGRELWVVSLQNCPLDFRRLCQVATTHRYEMQIHAEECKQINFKALQSKKGWSIGYAAQGAGAGISGEGGGSGTSTGATCTVHSP